MERLNSAFTLGYHGCSQKIARDLVSGKPFRKSDNDYDWLGPGVYFWEANLRRALSFAEEKRRREGAKWEPAVVGAVIDLGLCLDLTSEFGIEHGASAHRSFARIVERAGVSMPSNGSDRDKLLRKCDCAVIRHLHEVREAMNAPALDTVRGVFVEGAPIYDGAGFYEKTHIQVCVCNLQNIKGVFNVPKSRWKLPI